MKEVYTITFHKANNHGALLQAYALQKVIAKKYSTKILDYDNKYISDSYKLFKPFNGNIKHFLMNFIKSILNFKKEIVRKQHFNNFRKMLETSKKIKSITDLSNEEFEGCIFVTGSDQVWNPEITNGLDPIYTLNFTNNSIKKISYAASAGHNKALANYKNDLISIIGNYNAISVREDTLKELLIDKVTNKRIDTVLDPSLLLSKSEWEKFAGEDRLIKEKYLFVYCGDEPDYFYDIVNKIATERQCLIVYFGRRDRKNKFKTRKKSCYEYGPKEFVNLVRHSECVVTASFHGTALACILNKEMYIVLNRYPDRLKSLLEKIALSNRIVKSLDEYNSISKEKIDWTKTNILIEKERTKSISWLYDAISK